MKQKYRKDKMKLKRFFSLGNSMDLSTKTAILAAIKAGKRIRDNYHLLHQMENSPQTKKEKLEQTWIKEEEDPRTISSITDTESDRIIREAFLSAGNFVIFTEESGISTPQDIDSSSWKSKSISFGSSSPGFCDHQDSGSRQLSD